LGEMLRWMAMSTAVQQLFARLRTGDSSALTELTPTLYNELHRIASHHMRGERSDHALQPTALVHEAYLKLFDGAERRFADEVHFLAVASRVMRQVLVDYARGRSAQKRSADMGVSLGSTSMEVADDAGGMQLLELIELDGAIEALAAEDEPLARLIEMRFFGGMTVEETADAMGVSTDTVKRDWRVAKLWLLRALEGASQ